MMDLYISDDKCCGCEACCNVCPRQAITMKENRRGFVYPSIDEENVLIVAYVNRFVYIKMRCPKHPLLWLLRQLQKAKT